MGKPSIWTLTAGTTSTDGRTHRVRMGVWIEVDDLDHVLPLEVVERVELDRILKVLQQVKDGVDDGEFPLTLGEIKDIVEPILHKHGRLK